MESQQRLYVLFDWMVISELYFVFDLLLLLLTLLTTINVRLTSYVELAEHLPTTRLVEDIQ